MTAKQVLEFIDILIFDSHRHNLYVRELIAKMPDTPERKELLDTLDHIKGNDEWLFDLLDNYKGQSYDQTAADFRDFSSEPQFGE